MYKSVKIRSYRFQNTRAKHLRNLHGDELAARGRRGDPPARGRAPVLRGRRRRARGPDGGADLVEVPAPEGFFFSSRFGGYLRRCICLMHAIPEASTSWSAASVFAVNNAFSKEKPIRIAAQMLEGSLPAVSKPLLPLFLRRVVQFYKFPQRLLILPHRCAGHAADQLRVDRSSPPREIARTTESAAVSVCIGTRPSRNNEVRHHHLITPTTPPRITPPSPPTRTTATNRSLLSQLDLSRRSRKIRLVL